ncbi:oxidoreductase [Gluconacetobacter johannae DSM 13595]|uniref:SDR family oxidoreductase n=1 Tax=Gluconacetobacter johannae TaxID=112140 RepID=A0A7W4J804_9PROT|nr:SDR family NAD(P)-dependent oxidoreductase [Gluconacetobacter johannae]MBB2176420.1 SDR family oxidoreductase [Gluconacetobacter johannae]GBQ91919.1 oxidoreductase [Gluconacetobacter johannae DSM 13595]
MKIDLTGRTAIVTGSTAGIGLAIVVALAETGAEVVVNGRGQDRVDEALAHVRARVPTARLRGVAGDLGTEAGVAAFIQTVPRADILVNNLGIFEQAEFLQTPDSAWQHFFDVNVMSGVRLTRHYLPGMVEGKWGRVVFISSESALNIPADMIAYGFSKAAQVAIARGLAESVPGTGVTINSVLPGPTRTEGVMAMFEHAARESGRPVAEIEAEFIPAHRPTSLIRRLAEPEEIASMVAYVCSPQASATTGATLRVEGGLLRHPG